MNHLYTALFALLLLGSQQCSRMTYEENRMASEKEKIINTEKTALDAWVNGNVYPFLNLFHDSATYIDEGTQLKLHGAKAIRGYIEPWQGQIFVDGYSMHQPQVKMGNDWALLSYNLYNFTAEGDTSMLWNCTELYRKYEGAWKIEHSHWSIVRDK